MFGVGRGTLTLENPEGESTTRVVQQDPLRTSMCPLKLVKLSNDSSLFYSSEVRKRLYEPGKSEEGKATKGAFGDRRYLDSS